VATVSSSEESLSLYGDDRVNPIIYSGDFDSKKIIRFVLKNFDTFIEQRASEAKELKAFQEFEEKEKERAKKEWEEEQALRKKSNTILLDAKSWESTFVKERSPLVVNFYESNCSACQSLNKEWELLSTELKGKVKVAKINLTESDNHRLEEDLKITNYPSIRFYRTGPKKESEFVEYQGTFKKFSILEWLNERLNEKVEKTDILPLNKDNYQALCKATKNTCIILFLDGSEPSDSLKNIEKLALEHIKKPVTFLVANKGEQSAFEHQAGVSSYPETVMVYCKLKKIYRMGGLSIEEIDNTINEISLGNRNNFVRYNFAENIV
jgi:thiol-disulfide isomerase/thioredoxin